MSDDTPLDVVRSAFAALSRHDWPTLAALVDPESLDRFRDLQIGALLAEQDSDARSPSPGAGALIAIGSLNQEARTARGDVRIHALPGSPTVSALGRQTGPEFFVQWQRAAHHVPWMLKWLTVLFFRRAPVRPQPALIGTVIDGDALAHVLYREDYVPADSLEVGVQTVKRRGSTFLLHFDEPWSMGGPFLEGGFQLHAAASFRHASGLMSRLAGLFSRTR